MYYLEITKDMETTEPVELITIFDGHAVKLVGYSITNDWRNAFRIDEREYDGNADDLEQDLNYIKKGLQKMLTGDYMAIWTRD